MASSLRIKPATARKVAKPPGVPFPRLRRAEMPAVYSEAAADSVLAIEALSNHSLTPPQVSAVLEPFRARQQARLPIMSEIDQQAAQLRQRLAELKGRLAGLGAEVVELEQQAAAVAPKQQQQAEPAPLQPRVTAEDSNEMFSFAVVTQVVQDWVPSWPWAL